MPVRNKSPTVSFIFTIFVIQMKIRDKYKSLRDPKTAKQKAIASAYATMMLEGQGVSKKRIAEIYDEVQKAKSKA